VILKAQKSKQRKKLLEEEGVKKYVCDTRLNKTRGCVVALEESLVAARTMKYFPLHLELLKIRAAQ
jgi:hypothetical protein